MTTRRDMLGTAAALGGAWALGGAAFAQSGAAAQAEPPAGPYVLPPLPYDYADLDPHIDPQTMKLHHDVHHAAYVKGANAAWAELERIRKVGGDDIARVRAVTDALTFNAAGHALHSIFWTNMKKSGGGDPPAGSQAHGIITRDFGSIDAFRAHFSAASVQVQGGGWGLLAWEPMAAKLLILQAEKQQNLTVWGVTPILTLDVWEHAYYLRYQSKRADYIKAWWNVVNWDDVEQRLTAAMKR